MERASGTPVPTNNVAKMRHAVSLALWERWHEVPERAAFPLGKVSAKPTDEV